MDQHAMADREVHRAVNVSLYFTSLTLTAAPSPSISLQCNFPVFVAQVEMHAGGGRCGVGAGSARRKRRRISTPSPALLRRTFFCTCNRAGAPCARGCRFRPETNRQLGTWRAPGPFSMRTRVRTSHRTATTPHTVLFLWVLEVSAVAGAQPPPSLCRWCVKISKFHAPRWRQPLGLLRLLSGVLHPFIPPAEVPSERGVVG